MGSRAIKGRHNIKKKSGKAVVIAILAIIVALIVSLFVGISALANSWLEDLPDYTNTDQFATSATSTVYASDGTTVLAEFQLENRDPVELEQISDYVKWGTVATEDERFYSHNGVDLYGTARALVNNLLGRSREGGSTITQQLVRNTVLSEEMTEISIKRKVREMFIALKVEEMYDKDDILLMYLNTINYGSGSYGIEAASQRYFSKPATELTLAEAATLVGIPQSPTYNNPIDHIENCLARRNVVLDRMVSNGYITADEGNAAKAEEIVLNPTAPSTTGITKYPYFTSYVRNQLLNENGMYEFSVADIFAGGLEIVTTLDVDAQEKAEAAAQAKAAESNGKFEVAMVALDNNNGDILAMVGGENYDQQQVNMATGEGSSGRQCGSSFKMFTLLAAIEQGIDPQTLIDAGATVELDGAEPVHNIDNHDYGTRTIASAFAVSSNTAFVRLLLSVGVDKVKEMAERLGISGTLQEVAGLTLGINSTTPLEMAAAYSTVANGGIYYAPQCILTITDKSGNVIVDNSEPEGERLLSEEVACAAIQVAQGVVTERGATGTVAAMSNGQPVAGKTGTTDDRKDNWFIGFTPEVTAAFWLGERADSYEDASFIPNNLTAVSVFAAFMNSAYGDHPITQFKTAADPEYINNYLDSKNHVGKGSWSSEDTEVTEDGDQSDHIVDYDPDTDTWYNNDDDSDDGSGWGGGSGGSWGGHDDVESSPYDDDDFGE